MESNLTHKGCTGLVSFIAEEEVFYGIIQGTEESLTFKGASLMELKKSFRDAVEFHLKTSARLEKEPNRPYKGVFNVRLSPELHQKAGLFALCKGISLNDLVRKAIIFSLENENEFIKR